MPEIRMETITGKECLRLKPLWEEVFTQDAGSFADYYFQEKAENNLCLVITEEKKGGKEDAAMLHLTPYPVQVRTGKGFACIEACYIVGVATLESARHRGYMRKLLANALRLLSERRQPFTFLMPADPAIYTPFDFVYIYDRIEYEWSGRKQLKAAWTQGFAVTPLTEEQLPELVDFASRSLFKGYDVFVRRDSAYYLLRQKELAVMDGEIRLIKRWLPDGNGRLCGYFLIAREEDIYIHEAFLPQAYENELPLRERREKKPIIMGRITHMERMFSLLRTSGETVQISFLVKDKMIEKNNGLYDCVFGPEETKVTVLAAGGGAWQGDRAAAQADIDQMALWIFGRKKAEECFAFTDHKQLIIKNLNKIMTLGRVYLNEIV